MYVHIHGYSSTSSLGMMLVSYMSCSATTLTNLADIDDIRAAVSQPVAVLITVAVAGIGSQARTTFTAARESSIDTRAYVR